MAIYSMTGFAAVDVKMGPDDAQQLYRIELRSVNHRHLDVRFKIGRELAAFEPSLMSRIKSSLSRGHVDVFVDVDNTDNRSTSIQVDEKLAQELGESLRRLSTAAGITEPVPLRSLLSFSDVIRVEQSAFCVADYQDVLLNGMDQAVAALQEMRRAEGERLKDDLESHLNTLGELVLLMEKEGPSLVQAQRTRLQRRITEMMDSTFPVDTGRIELEIAILADRTDVTEELTRLKSHLQQFQEELSSEDRTSGKKLSFIAQELLREINTIGSKISDVEVVRHVIDGKCEVEKIKEQLANIE
jgi:uncharacterized protein (TIGR00255 family)